MKSHCTTGRTHGGKKVKERRCNWSISCKGCGKKFGCHRYVGIRKKQDSAFVKHCLEECEDYKKLHLAQEFEHCERKFLTRSSLSSHLMQAHREEQNPFKRSWMTNHNKKLANIFTAQQGHWLQSLLNKVFPLSSVTIHYSVDLCRFIASRNARHIRELGRFLLPNICVVFWFLLVVSFSAGLIQTCNCGCKLINKTSYHQHKRSCSAK